MNKKQELDKTFSPKNYIPILSGITKVVPQPVKTFLKPIDSRIKRSRIYKLMERKYFNNRVSHDAILEYWSKPPDEGNQPECYLPEGTVEGKKVSLFLLEIVNRYAEQTDSILEIGCNVGRNLDYLYRNGFHNLEAIEISEDAVKLLHEIYPKTAGRARIYNSTVEALIKDFTNEQFDIVFTVAVLYHIHTNSDWIFPEIARITGKHLITIENEYATTSWMHFPRNYRKIFQSAGMKQVEKIDCGKIPSIKHQYNHFIARIFKK